MRKVTVIVLYKQSKNHDYFRLYNITAKYKSRNILLFPYSSYSKQTNKYSSFKELYKSVLNILKANSLYVYSYSEFNTTWYDIDFISLGDHKINRYAYQSE